MTEIQKADPRIVRLALMVIGGGVLAGSGAIWWLGDWRAHLEGWVSADPGARVPIVVGLMTLLLAGPLLGFAAYVWRLGPVGAERYPPPRMRMVRETPIVVGPAAIRRGQWLRGVALVIVVAALLLTLMLWRLVRHCC